MKRALHVTLRILLPPPFLSVDSLASWIAAISQPARLNLVALPRLPRGSLVPLVSKHTIRYQDASLSGWTAMVGVTTSPNLS